MKGFKPEEWKEKEELEKLFSYYRCGQSTEHPNGGLFLDIDTKGSGLSIQDVRQMFKRIFHKNE